MKEYSEYNISLTCLKTRQTHIYKIQLGLTVFFFNLTLLRNGNRRKLIRKQ